MAVMTIREFFPAAADEVAKLVEATDPAALATQTPCSDFDLRALINHFVGTTRALATVGRRNPMDAADPYGSRQDPSTGAWQQELTANLRDLAVVWSDPRAWTGAVDMGGGPSPAIMIGEMAMAEILLHGWDLAQATGQQLSVPAALARELRRSIEQTADLGRAMGAYGPQVPVTAGASEFDRALAASGRDPHWRPVPVTSGA
jgi:uncharacterized protein (TIGR03086 family)